MDELPSILWASRTTPKIGSGESPFSLVYGMEMILPPEVIFPTLRMEAFDKATSKERLRAWLDMIKEQRAKAHLQTLRYKQAVAKLYNQWVQ